jgi:head-tail adaptor
MRSAGTVRTGDLNRRTLWELPVSTPDATYGTPVITWKTFDTVYAQVQDALPSRAEGVTLGLSVAKNQSRVRRYWRAGITSAMRVTLLDVTPHIVMQIVGGPADIGGLKRFIEVQCERVSS